MGKGLKKYYLMVQPYKVGKKAEGGYSKIEVTAREQKTKNWQWTVAKKYDNERIQIEDLHYIQRKIQSRLSKYNKRPDKDFLCLINILDNLGDLGFVATQPSITRIHRETTAE